MAKLPTSENKPVKTPKLTGPEEVAAFFNQLNHPLKRAMEEVRTSILRAQPDMTEHIKWKAPSFCYAGDDRITFNIHKDNSLLLIFHRGAKVKDTHGKDKLYKDSTSLLEWLASDRAVVKFTSLQEVKEKKDKLLIVVNEWIAHTK